MTEYNEWHPMEYNRYALEWYQYGLDKGDDLIIQFMMHWIAFNWLYSECHEYRERDAIIKFCSLNYESLSRFSAFAKEETKVFLESPVYNERSSRRSECKEIHRGLRRGSKSDRITCLLLTIYQVRCNLFHGSKSIKSDRDIALIHSSATIMRGYLEALLINNPSQIFFTSNQTSKDALKRFEERFRTARENDRRPRTHRW